MSECLCCLEKPPQCSVSSIVATDVRSLMLSLNRRLQVNVPALQKIMLEFARENERSELTGELIGDTLDDALADDGDAEAEDKIVSQVSVSSD